MSLKIIVLAKQVPDTRNVGKDAMKEDGTINRAALPAIFNPEVRQELQKRLFLQAVLKAVQRRLLLHFFLQESIPLNKLKQP